MVVDVCRQGEVAQFAVAGVGHLDDVRHLAVAARGQYRDVRRRLEHRAEQGGEAQVLLIVEVLLAEHQDVVLAQRLLERQDLLRRQRTTRVEATDLGAQRRLQGSDAKYLGDLGLGCRAVADWLM